MTQQFNRKLQLSTRARLERFNSLRGREVRSSEFWDVVILTAVDESQRAAYELQVRAKVERGELPLGIHYKVFSDPPGNKVGNGGSTLFALQQLDEIYGAALSGMRVILIHAGGFSQRLPSASALGKIFSAVPLGDPMYQMLELKLAMYVDFPSHMAPGVLVTCADDIELYSVAEDQHVTFDRPGFTALAHPSSLSIGTTHGVFVLDSGEEKSSDLEMENRSCLRFLHKPSIKGMQERGAVCKRRSSPSLPEFVYTDSTYYFDHGTTKTLLLLLGELGPPQCEIDAYGDFLQALGPEATDDYTSNTANVAKEERGLVGTRQRIFQRLRGTPLNVVLLNNSKFYHIGTTAEFLFHLTQDEALRSELDLLSSAFSVPASGGPGRCVMHSVVDPSFSVGAGSVVEYCRVGAGASVGERSILSSCWVGAGLHVPDNVFMHSLCVHHPRGAGVGFVTVAFGIDDDLKRRVDSPADSDGLKLFGLSLSQCLSCWGWDEATPRFSGDSRSCSLWNARLFPVRSDQRSSFASSLEMLRAVLAGSSLALTRDTEMMSMQECLQRKNLEGMMEFRTGLYNDITQRTHNH